MKLRLDAIQRNGGTQSRAELDGSAIDAYGEAMQRGDAFPPIVVFYDGEKYWVADGFHRIEGASLIGWTELEADVHQGTRRDAILFSVGANAHHGVRRTPADKRRAVEVLLADDEWGSWGDREVARACNVSHTFVAKLRKTSNSPTSGNVATPAAGASIPKPTPSASRARPIVAAPPSSPPTPAPLRDEKLAVLVRLEDAIKNVHDAAMAAQRERGPQDSALVAMLEDHGAWIARACRRGAA